MIFNACFRMKRAVQENIQNCEDTAKWGQCIQPDSPSCAVPNEVDSWDAIVGARLLYRLIGIALMTRPTQR